MATEDMGRPVILDGDERETLDMIHEDDMTDHYPNGLDQARMRAGYRKVTYTQRDGFPVEPYTVWERDVQRLQADRDAEVFWSYDKWDGHNANAAPVSRRKSVWDYVFVILYTVAVMALGGLLVYAAMSGSLQAADPYTLERVEGFCYVTGWAFVVLGFLLGTVTLFTLANE